MKAVLISIKPQWAKLIAEGKKTVEVRKTKPKLDVPFKCYIYCAQGKEMLWILNQSERAFHEKIASIITAKDVGGATKANGKVIGEFVCDRIDYIGKRGINNNFDYCYLSLNKFGNDDIEIEITDIKKSCISKDELNAYGDNSSCLYAWHITDLVIYDNPKELGEFKPYNRDCKYSHLGYAIPECKYCHGCQVTRPPMSWMFVEGV